MRLYLILKQSVHDWVKVSIVHNRCKRVIFFWEQHSDGEIEAVVEISIKYRDFIHLIVVISFFFLIAAVLSAVGGGGGGVNGKCLFGILHWEKQEDKNRNS